MFHEKQVYAHLYYFNILLSLAGATHYVTAVFILWTLGDDYKPGMWCPYFS